MCVCVWWFLVYVERWMIENNVIELWLLALEYKFCDNDCYEYFVYKVSLGYVALALVCCLPYGYVALRAVVTR
jgi:hypothetical protein